jgi:hypothetical protein
MGVLVIFLGLLATQSVAKFLKANDNIIINNSVPLPMSLFRLHRGRF